MFTMKHDKQHHLDAKHDENNNHCEDEYEPEYETELVTITNDISFEILTVIRKCVFFRH
jgi:hypothetical protein